MHEIRFRLGHRYNELLLLITNNETHLLAWRIGSYSRLRSSKVIDLGLKAHMRLPISLVITSNFGRISYRFQDIDV